MARNLIPPYGPNFGTGAPPVQAGQPSPGLGGLGQVFERLQNQGGMPQGMPPMTPQMTGGQPPMGPSSMETLAPQMPGAPGGMPNPMEMDDLMQQLREEMQQDIVGSVSPQDRTFKTASGLSGFKFRKD